MKLLHHYSASDARVGKAGYLMLVALLLATLLAGCGSSDDIKNTTPVPPNLEVVTAAPLSETPENTTAAPTTAAQAIATTAAVATTANSTAAVAATTASSTAAVAATATTALATTTVASSPTAAIAATPTVAKAAAIKQGVLLEPMSWEHQTWNNCAPMSIIYALSYYGVKLTQEECGKALRPSQGTNNAANSGDKHVYAEEIVSYVRGKGFKAVIRENGTFDILRQLLAAGVPVITQQWLHDGDEIGHYRTARGYDLNTNTIIFNDAMADGPKTVVSTTAQEKLWKGWNRRYIPIYTAKLEPTVMAILGPDADQGANMKRAMTAALQYAESNPKDIDAWRNVGYLNYAAGDCKAALNIWETRLTKMLVPNETGPYNHFLWYQLWPVECYNKLGNYQQVIKIMPNELEKTRIYAEGRYEYAVALNAVGRKADAIAQLKLSLLDDTYYTPTRTLLDKLQG